MFAERKELLKKIEAFTDSKVILYVTGDRQKMELQIADDIHQYFLEHLDKIGVVKKISLIIYTRGGNTLTGWSLVNLIKQFCDEYNVMIPSKCHSTGTLMALGAKSILMTKQATLSPIDPSVNGPLNPEIAKNNQSIQIPISVESIMGYFDLIRSLKIWRSSHKMALMRDLAQKVHPVVLGNVYRTRSQIRMLGKRLLAGQVSSKDKIEKILDFLCSESGSHDYTIYRREAKDTLGLNIIKPTDEQYRLIKQLQDDFSNEMSLLIPYDANTLLGTSTAQNYKAVRGLIESVEGGSTKFLTEGRMTKVQVPVGPGQFQEGIQDQRLFEGWKND